MVNKIRTEASGSTIKDGTGNCQYIIFNYITT